MSKEQMILEPGQAHVAPNAVIGAGAMIHESSYVDAGAEIGAGTRVWHFCHILSGAKIGAGCSLGQNVVVMSKVTIGNNVKVQNNVSVYDGVEIEDDVFCGPSMVFTNVYNPRSAVSRKDEYRRTVVRKGASIGANATIICGTTIGRYAFIGAGAVVKKDVPEYAMMAGVPARRIGWISEEGHRLEADGVWPDGGAGERLRCSGTGALYERKGEVVRRIPSPSERQAAVSGASAT